MKVEAGDVVKVKNGIIKRVGGGEFIFIDTKERFVVLNPMDNSVKIKSLNRSLEIVIGIPFIEVQPKPKEKKLLSETDINKGKGKMPKGTVVKIGVNELTDAHEWLRTNGCDIKLNSNEHFTVDIETTKIVFIYSKDKGEVICLPKRFLEEVTPERIKLNKQGILALIDLALDTGDKQWFDELHSKLSALA